MKGMTTTVAAAVTMGAITLWTAGISNAEDTINDPVAYWSFTDAGNGLVNPVTSGPYHDASVLAGQPAFGLLPDTAGIVGNAMVLDGSSAIRLPYHQDNLGKSFTISLWYWQLTNDTRQAVYETRDNYTASYCAEGSVYSNFSSWVGEAATGGSNKIGLKEWNHLVHVFSTAAGTTTLSVYTNGVLSFATSTSVTNVFVIRQVRGFHVGSDRFSTGSDRRFFKGMIDELALWDRALTPQEAQAVYQRGAGGQTLEVTPKAQPSISLEGKQRSFALHADDGVPEGVFYDGWLTQRVTRMPRSAMSPIRRAMRPGRSTPRTPCRNTVCGWRRPCGGSPRETSRSRPGSAPPLS